MSSSMSDPPPSSEMKSPTADELRKKLCEYCAQEEEEYITPLNYLYVITSDFVSEFFGEDNHIDTDLLANDCSNEHIEECLNKLTADNAHKEIIEEKMQHTHFTTIYQYSFNNFNKICTIISPAMALINLKYWNLIFHYVQVYKQYLQLKKSS